VESREKQQDDGWFSLHNSNRIEEIGQKDQAAKGRAYVASFHMGKCKGEGKKEKTSC